MSPYVLHNIVRNREHYRNFGVSLVTLCCVFRRIQWLSPASTATRLMPRVDFRVQGSHRRFRIPAKLPRSLHLPFDDTEGNVVHYWLTIVFFFCSALFSFKLKFLIRSADRDKSRTCELAKDAILTISENLSKEDTETDLWDITTSQGTIINVHEIFLLKDRDRTSINLSVSDRGFPVCVSPAT